jgi:hypothetical protein
MLSIKWERLQDAHFKNALLKLNGSAELDNKNSYRVGRIIVAADKAMRAYNVQELELRMKHCSLDEKGNPTDQFKSEEARKAYETATQTILSSNVVEVKATKLDFTAIEKVKNLSGVERVVIEEIMDGVPEVA